MIQFHLAQLFVFLRPIDEPIARAPDPVTENEHEKDVNPPTILKVGAGDDWRLLRGCRVSHGRSIGSGLENSAARTALAACSAARTLARLSGSVARRTRSASSASSNVM